MGSDRDRRGTMDDIGSEDGREEHGGSRGLDGTSSEYAREGTSSEEQRDDREEFDHSRYPQ